MRYVEEVDVINGTSTWIQSYSGRKIDFINPDPASFNIRDIAIALSRQVRYSGHGKFFYSVAQHCCLAATHAENIGRRDLAVHALLHDAHEAYTGDIPGPLKSLLGESIKHIEFKLQDAIYNSLKLVMPTHEEADVIYRIDKSLLHPECNALFSKALWRQDGVIPADVRVEEWTMIRAETDFINWYFGALRWLR